MRKDGTESYRYLCPVPRYLLLVTIAYLSFASVPPGAYEGFRRPGR